MIKCDHRFQITIKCDSQKHKKKIDNRSQKHKKKLEWKPKGMLAVSAGGDKCAYVLGYLTAIMALRKRKYNCSNDQTVYVNMCGTSAGAILCAKFLQYLDNPCQFDKAVVTLFNSLSHKKLVDRWNPFGFFLNAIESVFFHGSLYRNNLPAKIKDMLNLQTTNDMYKDHNLSIGVWNLNKMEYETLRNPKDLELAVTASASVPFIFEPVEIDGQLYVDGGVGHVIPVLEIIKWCETVKEDAEKDDAENIEEHLDIMVCYPFEQESFTASLYTTTSHKMMNNGQLALYGVLWTNLHNDLQILNEYFNINIEENRYFICKLNKKTKLHVRVFAPSTPILSDFLDINVDVLNTMKEDGECIAKTLLECELECEHMVMLNQTEQKKYNLRF